MKPAPHADVCLILEGTYPFVSGGVSNWTHELILMQNHLRFAIVALVAADAKPELKFELPPNVTEVRTVFLQKLPSGAKRLHPARSQELFGALEAPLAKLQDQPSLQDLGNIIAALAPHRHLLGDEILLNSREAWDLLRRMYDAQMPESSFLDYFWSWRVLFAGLYSVLLFDLPEASVYHALCTGYAGLALARAGIETGRPCLVTEHGIYTNERRIEIASADWLEDQRSFDLSISGYKRTLKDFWSDIFSGYSRICYESCSRIITLYEGNQAFQRNDGAREDKLLVIPNGIDCERYMNLPRARSHPPTIALIGRVVPIKDVKTYIKAAGILASSFPHLQALIMGPMDEDPDYFEECQEIIAHLGLEQIVTFTGKVRIEDYLPRIDIVVLTSISEAQPLVILEAGAAGIPTVATNVGACAEMILGSHHENPSLGPGGAVCALVNAQSTAAQLLRLLTDSAHYAHCSKAIRARVQRYYSKKDQYSAYAALYEECLNESRLRKVA